MSVYVQCFIEAKYNNAWHSIDFYALLDGHTFIAPVMTGQSSVHSAITWHGADMPIGVSDVSRELVGICSSGYRLSMMDGAWFEKRNLDTPEFCGYLPRQQVMSYYAGEYDDDYELDDSQLLFADDFAKLSLEAQKAYAYIEFTPMFGYRDTMRTIKEAMRERINHFNAMRYHFKDNRPPSIGWKDVRLVICTC